VDEREKRRTEEEADVEAHRPMRRDDEGATQVDPEGRAGASREDEEPDVEAHRPRY
jgi:hypothetical protein